MRSIVSWLAEARDRARHAASYVDAIDQVSFAADTMRMHAVCFCLTVVGEACNQAAKDLTNLPSEIPWTEIKGMRNILVHEYWHIDEAVVYNVARNEAQQLASQLDKLIASLSQA
jgi:uncharacterized protein with HEPN domain